MLDAVWRHAVQFQNTAGPSCHWPVCGSWSLPLLARLTLVSVVPVAVVFISGSPVRRALTVMRFGSAIVVSFLEVFEDSKDLAVVFGFHFFDDVRVGVLCGAGFTVSKSAADAW